MRLHLTTGESFDGVRSSPLKMGSARAGLLLLGLLAIAGCSRGEGESKRLAQDPAETATPIDSEDDNIPSAPMRVVEGADGPVRALGDLDSAGSLGAASRDLTPLSDAQRNAPAVRAAAAALASSLDLSSEQVEPLAVEEVTWPDSSLGCPQPGQMYAQVLTPGYRVTLRAGTQAAIYHTDRGEGRAPSVVRCDPGQESGAGLRMLAGDALDEIRQDLEERFAGEALMLETSRVAPVSTLDCTKAGTAPGSAVDLTSGGRDADIDMPKVVLEHVFEIAGERHLYRSWLDAYVYCGQLPEPFAPPSKD